MKKKNMNGEGHLTRRKDGLYQINVWHEGRYKSFYGKTENEALKKFRVFQANRQLGLVSTEVSFSVYMEGWLYNNKKDRIRPTSFERLLRTYKCYVRDEIGNVSLSKLTSQQCQDVINKWSKKYRYSTVKKIYELMNACLRYAVGAGNLAKNPMAIVSIPREGSFSKTTKEIRIPEPDEFEHFIEIGGMIGPDGNYVYYQVYVKAYRFISVTGLRIGELLGLTWDKISFENRTARIDCSVTELSETDENDEKHMKRIVGEPKTRNGFRTIALNSTAIQMLKEIQEEYVRRFGDPEPRETVILNTKGNYPTEHDLLRTLKAISKRAGTEYMTLHVLRHYFASRCIASGKLRNRDDTLVISRHLGHARPSITMNIYAHVMDKQSDEFRELLETI